MQIVYRDPTEGAIELACGTTNWANLFSAFRWGLECRAQRILMGRVNLGQLTADDLVQETFLRAWTGRKNFRGHTMSEVAGYLFSIMQHTATDQLRKRKLLHKSSACHMVCPDASPSQLIVISERESHLHACLAKLDLPTATIISLRHFEGLKFICIAERLQENINTIVGRYRRGLVQLSNLLRTIDSASSVWFPTGNFAE